MLPIQGESSAFGAKAIHFTGNTVFETKRQKVTSHDLLGACKTQEKSIGNENVNDLALYFYQYSRLPWVCRTRTAEFALHRHQQSEMHIVSDSQTMYLHLVTRKISLEVAPTTSRVPCTKVLSQEIQIFQETSFCVLQDLLRNFTNTLWQLYIDFYTIRRVFKSSFQLCTFKVANLKKLWQFWQKCVYRTFVHVKHGAMSAPYYIYW